MASFHVEIFTVSVVYLVLVGVCGVTANGHMVFLFARYRKVGLHLFQTRRTSVLQLRTDFNYLLLNLILTELAVSCLGIPVDAVASYQQGWKMGEAICQVVGFCLTFLGMNVMLSLMCVSVFRWTVLSQQVGGTDSVQF